MFQFPRLKVMSMIGIVTFYSTWANAVWASPASAARLEAMQAYNGAKGSVCTILAGLPEGYESVQRYANAQICSLPDYNLNTDFQSAMNLSQQAESRTQGAAARLVQGLPTNPGLQEFINELMQAQNDMSNASLKFMTNMMNANE